MQKFQIHRELNFANLLRLRICKIESFPKWSHLTIMSELSNLIQVTYWAKLLFIQRYSYYWHKLLDSVIGKHGQHWQLQASLLALLAGERTYLRPYTCTTFAMVHCLSFSSKMKTTIGVCNMFLPNIYGTLTSRSDRSFTEVSLAESKELSGGKTHHKDRPLLLLLP